MTRSGLRVITEAPHLRHLVVLVLLGSTSAALLDYLFKAKAVEAIGTGDQLLRFFALYYAAISVITFIFQVAPAGSRWSESGWPDDEHAVDRGAGGQHRRARHAGVRQPG